MFAYLLCRDCRVLHQVYAAHELAAGAEVFEAAAIAYGRFLLDHRHHALEQVRRESVVAYDNGPLWDPGHAAYFEVGDGEHSFTVSRTRASIEEARELQLIDGSIEQAAVELSVEGSALRRALDHHFFPYALRLAKLDHFVEAARAVIATLPSDTIEPVFDDANDPALSIARLPDQSCIALLERCLGVFDAWELPRVAAFISANRDEYGALALNVRRPVTLRPMNGRRARVVTP
ncbi:MAG: hypothetical protein HY699_06405 [Deltaproteobacteria bacterium]|nr:hypothetical protein [Deltaproteobacteria bacterium]